jgi:tetratricopeptide (TPR) repeat protein
LPAEAPANESKCREWSAAGRNDRAVECFRAVARGGGLESEIALYEAARLSADSLHDPARALVFLADYAKRFSNGAMRGEAAWLRVRALRDAGRLDDALTSSEALLASTEGRALASELHWLRGQIYQENRHDCAHALSEFVALVGEPGERGDAAEVRRGRCLEQLGRTEDAVQAYQRYLKRPDARRAAEARERLAALRP